ncbi:hypothetical protein Trydic_g8440 [Trypoxylus dichotomus]
MASSSSSLSSSWSPTHYLDNMLRAYEEDIKCERRLINEVRYYLNSSTFVSVGLSPARGFIPVVKLMNLQNCITFTYYEWKELLTNQYHYIQEHLKKKQKKKKSFDVEKMEEENRRSMVD